MTGQILTLAIDNAEEPTYRNIPACLRVNADQVESGEQPAVSAVLITMGESGELAISGMGSIPEAGAGNALAIILKAAEELRDMLVNASK